jgi:hypothetical protein
LLNILAFFDIQRKVIRDVEIKNIFSIVGFVLFTGVCIAAGEEVKVKNGKVVPVLN